MIVADYKSIVILICVHAPDTRFGPSNGVERLTYIRRARLDINFENMYIVCLGTAVFERF